MKKISFTLILFLLFVQFIQAQESVAYPALIRKALATTEAHIYDPALMETDAWQNFKTNLITYADTVTSDQGLKMHYNSMRNSLPFSHYFFYKPRKSTTSASGTQKRQYASLSSPQEGVQLLKVKGFGGSAEEMDSLMALVVADNPELLIIDLRDNPGGTVRAGMALARRLVSDTLFGGLFLTRKWFANNQHIPSPDEYASFPHFTEASFSLMIDGIHNEEALCLKVNPHDQPFTGKMVFLTNKNTGSTCEPIVYAMKQYGLATLVGQTTDGAMLNGEKFTIDGYALFMPTAEYYAADGFRIDQQGVSPDVALPADEDALEWTLKNWKDKLL